MKSVARRATAIVLATAIALVAAGCAGEPLTTREKGTLLGGGLGAATGAIVGAAVGSPGAGAAIGGGLGAVTGALVGNELQNHEDREKHIEARLRAQQREIEQQRREIERLEQEAMLY
jgi:outer membrane lipoprotein SlyB